jgi:hypothetical protein
MSVRNSYPEKPIVAFAKTSIPMQKIEYILKLSTAHKEVKAAALVIIRNETANGASVINKTNVSGVQSDSGRWASIWDSKIVATCIKNENQTGKTRGFVVFDKLESGINFLINQIENKGLFIGEHVDSRYYKGDVTTLEQLAVAYWQEWVQGDKTQPAAQMVKDFISMYKQAILKFS